MTIEELNKIIGLADESAISTRLRENGYLFCNEDEKLGKVGIMELVHAITAETEEICDEKRKHLFKGYICKSVKGYENYEFVFVNVYDIKPSADPFDDEEFAMQTDMLIWAKEL